MAVTAEDAWIGYRARLLAYITARTRSSQDAEDILQDVFEKVHRCIGTLRDDAHLAPWLYRVTHNAIVDHYRRRRPVPTANEPTDHAEEELPIAEQRLAPFLNDLIAELPPIYREALTLTELEGLTQAAMAQRLGLSASGAKSRVQRGRALLRRQLLACCRVDVDRRGRVAHFEQHGNRSSPSGCVCAPKQVAEG
jgi:RNA polymerase sigma-70 factor (ECF subfamily)